MRVVSVSAPNPRTAESDFKVASSPTTRSPPVSKSLTFKSPSESDARIAAVPPEVSDDYVIAWA